MKCLLCDDEFNDVTIYDHMLDVHYDTHTIFHETRNRIVFVCPICGDMETFCCTMEGWIDHLLDCGGLEKHIIDNAMVGHDT